MKRLSLAVCLFVLLAGATLLAEVQPNRPAVQGKALQTKALADFNNPNEAAKVKPLHDQVKAFTSDAAGKGLQIQMPAQEALPSVQLWQAGTDNGDWSGFDFLRMSVTNTGKARTTVYLYFQDAGQAKRGEFGFGIDAGQQMQIAVPLGLFYRADKSGTVDLKKMSTLQLAIERQPVPASLLVDGLTLAKVFDGPDNFFIFDLQGPDQIPVAQTIPVSPTTEYTKEKGYGLVKPAGLLTANPTLGKFPVFGDGLMGKKVSFAVDLPNGKYEVQATAFGMAFPNIRCLNYSIEAEGKKVVDVPLTEDAFYSPKAFYWGTELFHNPNQTMWSQYGRDYFKPHVFEVEVADGQLNLDFNDCAVFAIALYPAAQADKGRNRVEAFQGEYDWRVQTSVARLVDAPDAGKPLDPDQAAKNRGFQLFARHYTLMVYPNRNPRPEELLTKLQLRATPGEYEPATFVVRPLKDLKNVKIEVSDLAGPECATIPKSAIKLDLTKYFPVKTGVIDYMLTPSYLLPCRPIDLYKDFNQQYWVTVHVPANRDDAEPGAYTGKITITPEGGPATDIPLELTVYPFTLVASPKHHGFFNAAAPGYQMVNLFPADRQAALSREVLENELKDMIAHGAEGNCLPGPEFVSVDKDGSNLKLDFKAAALYPELLKKYGLTKRDHITSAYSVMSALTRRGGLKELSPEFNKAFVESVRQTAEFWKQAGIPVMVQVIDEPRETALEDWNRNRATTVQLCKLARQAGNARTYVTPMGDTDVFGNHYTVMMPLMDVWMTHCWPGSMRGIYLAGKEKIAELWFYNNGLDRFQWGYHLWKSDSLGDFEWVYAWEPRGAKPLIDDAIGIGDNVVPYAKSVLPKLNYEWAREGVDDMRYFATLEAQIAAMKHARTTTDQNKTVQEANDFLTLVRRTIPDYPETDLITGAEAGAKYTEGGLKNAFDPWRQQAAEYIIGIKQGRPAKRVEGAYAFLPKKADEKTKTAICLLVDKAPTIDGKLDDAVWKNAPVQTDFISTATSEGSLVKTELRIVSDGKKIYFAFHCVEPKYGEMKAYATERDSDVWQDDAVELFLDTQNSKKRYCQAVVNTLGTILDAEDQDPSWNGDIQTAVQKGKGYWDLEIAISLDSMKAKVGPDVTWGVNFCRDRQVSPAENSSWTYVGVSFHDATKFGVLKFQSAPK